MTSPDDLSDLVAKLEQADSPESAEVGGARITGSASKPSLPRRRSLRQHRRSRKKLIAGIVGGSALVLAGGSVATALILVSGSDEDTKHESASTTASPTTPTPTPEETQVEETPEDTTDDTTEETTDDTTSDRWDIESPESMQVLVNKRRSFDPIDWAPDDLVQPNVPSSSGQPMRHEAATAIEKMYAAASADGVPFTIVSAYRSYESQVDLFASYVAQDGEAAAETYSARPGFSEHQTGLTADISECMGCALSEAFGETAEGLWLRENAYRFGFILRYEQGEEDTVGYVYEPWHFRYVGVDVATEMHDQGIANYEDYLGVEAAPDYR